MMMVKHKGMSRKGDKSRMKKKRKKGKKK